MLLTHWFSPSVLSTFSYATLGSAEMNEEKSVSAAPQYTMGMPSGPVAAAAAEAADVAALDRASSWNCTSRAPAISMKIATT